MKQEARAAIKAKVGIKEAEKPSVQCRKCLLYSREKICQVHMIKTRAEETCGKFTSQRKHPVFQGGGVSPR